MSSIRGLQFYSLCRVLKLFDRGVFPSREIHNPDCFESHHMFDRLSAFFFNRRKKRMRSANTAFLVISTIFLCTFAGRAFLECLLVGLAPSRELGTSPRPSGLPFKVGPPGEGVGGWVPPDLPPVGGGHSRTPSGGGHSRTPLGPANGLENFLGVLFLGEIFKLKPKKKPVSVVLDPTHSSRLPHSLLRPAAFCPQEAKTPHPSVVWKEQRIGTCTSQLFMFFCGLFVFIRTQETSRTKFPHLPKT